MKVISYSLAFFFIKFGAFAIMLWMPLFLDQTLEYSSTEIANLLTVYEIGELIGTLILGPITDALRGRRSPVLIVAIAFSSAVCFYLTFNF